MQPNHLKVKELDYELSICNIQPTGEVETKKKLLWGILSHENHSFSKGTVFLPNSPEIEVKEIQDPINDLQFIISGRK